MVLELFLPECVDEVGFGVIGGMLDQCILIAIFADLRVVFAEIVETLLFGGFYN